MMGNAGEKAGLYVQSAKILFWFYNEVEYSFSLKRLTIKEKLMNYRTVYRINSIHGSVFHSCFDCVMIVSVADPCVERKRRDIT